MSSFASRKGQISSSLSKDSAKPVFWFVFMIVRLYYHEFKPFKSSPQSSNAADMYQRVQRVRCDEVTAFPEEGVDKDIIDFGARVATSKSEIQEVIAVQMTSDRLN
ncbi:hypothetical protein AC578_6261 [Pseudocercospora eumusae]|uniref:Uncharacterized protein n=1 Tax=Pseudocercospora eumusae TaxID=321146 RepID=A0A139H028_9PEZI|nr:hypothetical protein AC578_6261 [Pseudocercospora eumusae]